MESVRFSGGEPSDNPLAGQQLPCLDPPRHRAILQ
jgi:hypothetical protein